MNKLNDWLQLAAALGVIIGLVLVAMELRQESNLTRAEMGFEYHGAIEDVHRSLQSETTSRAMAVACENPLEMTMQDHFIVESFFTQAWTALFSRENYMQLRGVFVDDLQISASWVAGLMFGCEYGRDWYRVNRQTVFEPLLPYLDEMLESGAQRNWQERVDELETRIRQRVESP